MTANVADLVVAGWCGGVYGDVGAPWQQGAVGGIGGERKVELV